MKNIVILPTYNEKENIVKIISQIQNLKLDLDILVVDDNSPDGTSDIVKNIPKTHNNKIFVLDRKEKNGLGKAYIAGFKWALKNNYGVIIQMDADLSHNPKYLVEMLKKIENFDLIIGSRYTKGGGTKGWGKIRKIISRGGGLYSKIILGSHINDLTGGFKCWKSSLLKKIQLDKVTSNGYSFQIEMNHLAEKSGAKILELPIIFTDRDNGKSKMSGKIVREAIWKVWQIKFKK
jgi:dolichol-phosphate mannosyltransferase